MNAYSAAGRPVDLGDETSSEEVAKRIPKARLVKAFNTMGWKTLETGSRPVGEDRLVIFLAGDDPQAKSVVAKLTGAPRLHPPHPRHTRDRPTRQTPTPHPY